MIAYDDIASVVYESYPSFVFDQTKVILYLKSRLIRIREILFQDGAREDAYLSDKENGIQYTGYKNHILNSYQDKIAELAMYLLALAYHNEVVFGELNNCFIHRTTTDPNTLFEMFSEILSGYEDIEIKIFHAFIFVRELSMRIYFDLDWYIMERLAYVKQLKSYEDD